jgi:DNA sulfur modification protein DndD
MKLISARFENFRLLRDLELNFSTDDKRNLTVIRAENETGKTTMLTALQWAFYGDEALPGDAKSYRLHPIDWQKPSCRITVQVDFETTPMTRAGRAGEPRRYRVLRTVTEDIAGANWKRGEPTLRFYDLAASGSDALDYAENRVRRELPPELREVFFTDGDRALSFIEADSTSVKRQRVENAIKALLGLSIVEDAAKHVKQAAADINRRVKESDASGRAREASKKIEQLDGEITDLETTLKTASEDRARCEDLYDKLTRQIESTLQQGDRAELVEDLRRIRVQRKREEQLELTLAKEQGDLLRHKLLARQLLAGHVSIAASLLDGLKEKGRIPNQTIPVLNERLTQKTCICGETLDPADSDGAKRRRHIEHLIEASRAADDTQKMITELYYGAHELMEPIADEGWKALYAELVDRRNKVAQNLRDLAASDAQTEAKIAVIPDTDLQMLRDQKKVARRNSEDHSATIARTKMKLEAAIRERKGAEEERDKNLKEESKGLRLAAELTVAQDLLRVFERSLERLKSDELGRVSALMNEIFLDMIGADAEQGAIIRRASISKEFDIVVFGPDERLLNPDRDLNGASRRALTLAFILALTKVSGVEAPNIIDTPLGMMSGYVKASVLQAAIKYSAQLILFLTRSEIAGTERLLEEFAGEVVTLTNPAHYPKMLLHEPASRTVQVTKCGCSYDASCQVCARKMDVDAGALTLAEALP